MGHDSTVKSLDLLSLEQFKLNAIVEDFKTMEERQFKDMTFLGEGGVYGRSGRKLQRRKMVRQKGWWE